MGKIFGLPKTVVKHISEEVISAVEQWDNWANQCDVSDKDTMNVAKIIQK